MQFPGLRAALYVTILLAIAPALLLTLGTYREQNARLQERASEEAHRLVQLAALDQDQVLEGTRQLLIALAQLPEVRTGAWPECTALFGAMAAHYEGYTNFGVADRTGEVRCSAVTNPQGVNIADREYFQRTLLRRGFAVGEYQIGRTTRQPNLGSGYPVLDGNGEVQAVVWAARDLSWLNQHVAAGELPPDATIMMLDSMGTVLARYPDPERWVGQMLPDTPLVRAVLGQDHGTVALPGLDGVERLHAFSTLRSSGGTTHVSVGLSQAALVGETNRLLVRNVLGILGAALFALLLTGIGGEVFLMRRVRRLVHAADRLRAGDLGARAGSAGSSGARDELAQLATAFDSMAEALAERTENLSAANQQLQSQLAERERSAEERARLVAELEERGAELEARFRELALLHEIGQSMLQTSDLEAFLQASLARIMPIGPYDLGVIRLLDARGQGIEWLASEGYHDAANVPGFRVTRDPADRGRTFRSLTFESATPIADLAAVEGFRSFKAEGAVSIVAVPIRTPDGLLGAFVVGTRTRRAFSEPEVRLLDAIGNQLGVAAQKARLYEEMQRSEEQLRQAQKMEAVGVLAGGIAHDFNNLLTAIMGFSELLLAEPSPEARPAYIEEIMKAGNRATSLTSQLLAFSRQQLLRPEVINLNHTVEEMDRLLQRVIGEDINIVTRLGSRLWSVWADPGQISQVLLNLAANSRDAMPTGGTLTIETANVNVREADSRELLVAPRSGPYVRLTVRDTGQGMSAATQERIFEPFFTTKEQGKGTGLGLSTVYGIVKQSGGELTVDSSPGRGTTFTIYLPRYEGALEVSEEPKTEPSLPRGAETVLLVEDEDGVRRLARAVLSGAGYMVLEAANGAEAMELATAHDGSIHLLVTDIVMPGMSGHELAEALTHVRTDTRVLYMSGYTPDVAIRHGVLESSVAYLQKPFAPAALAHKVREILDAEPALTPV